MNVAITFTAREMFGRQLSLTDAKALLSGLPLNEVLEFCAVLNAACEVSVDKVGGWRSEGGGILMNRLLVDLLHPVHHEKARRIFNSPGSIAPLLPTAVNALAILACKWCTTDSNFSFVNVRIRERATKVLFSLQGELISRDVIDALRSRDEMRLRATFPLVSRAILAGRTRADLEHDLGRLHAFITKPEIGDLMKQHGGGSVNDWFQNVFSLSATSYQKICTGLSGAAARFHHHRPNPNDLRLHEEQVLALFDTDRSGIERLLKICQTNPERVRGEVGEPRTMTEALFFADYLLLYPLLRVGDALLITSFDAIVKKLIRGIPYLATMSLTSVHGAATDQIVKHSRAGFGSIFEGYIGWCLRQWISAPGPQLVADFYVALEEGGCMKSAQRDFLIVQGDVGYAIEVKAKVPRRDVRQTGDLKLFLQHLSPIAMQAVQSAQAVQSGRAFFDAERKRQIRALRKVYPVALVFEHLPIRYPWSIPFEQDLGAATGLSLFIDSPEVGPLQFFDVDAFENCDNVFDLPTEVSLLLKALERRASAAQTRFARLDQIHGTRRANSATKPSLIDRLCDESERAVEQN